MESSPELYLRGFRNWYSAVGLAIAYEWHKRASRNTYGIGALTTFAEPMLMLATLIIFRVWLRDRIPRFGVSAAVFYASGILPYYLFQRLSTRGRMTKYEALQRLPRITSTDQVIAQISIDGSMHMVGLLLCFWGMWLFGLSEAMPRSAIDCAVPLVLLAMLGIGVGLASSAVTYFVPFWGYVWLRASRMLVFASGVFYIADLMELRIRQIIVWNPIVHAIDWFRVGLYGNYPDLILDRNYLIYWSFGMLLVGIVAHGGSLRRTPWT